VIRLALLLAALASCGKERISECDALLATIETIAACEKLPAEAREAVKAKAKVIRAALDQIEERSDRAPQSQVDAITANCRDHLKTIREQYAKVAPECLK